MKTGILKIDFDALSVKEKNELFAKLWKMRPENWEENPSWIKEAYKKMIEKK